MGSAISAFGSLAGGAAGQAAAAGDYNNAQTQAQTANQIIQQIGAAPDVSAPLILQQYKQAGLLTPQMEQQITAAVPQAIGQDKTAINAQTQALQQMQQRAAGGLSAGDRAALTQAGLQAQGDVQGRLGSIAQGMQQKGLSDSGSNLAAQLSAAQGGQNAESAKAGQIAQQAQQAAIQSSAQAAGLGSQLENQNFGEGMANQNAATQMQRFNVQNQLGVQQQNTNAANQAQAANLANSQQLSNANTGAANQELNNQLNREMAQYNANTNTAALQAGADNNYSKYLSGVANQKATSYQNYGTGAGQVGAGAYNSAQNSGSGSSGSGGSSGSNQFAGGDVSDASSMFAYNGGQAPDNRLNFKAGGHVPGSANVPGDHPANDTVKAVLSPGEIVIPRTLAKSGLGKKLLKLLEDHHHVQRELDKYGSNE